MTDEQIIKVIERLKKRNTLLLKKKCKDMNTARKIIKSEAIKEFAENLKEEMRFDDDCKYDCISCCYACKGFVPQIDKLVKEMTEGE